MRPAGSRISPTALSGPGREQTPDLLPLSDPLEPLVTNGKQGRTVSLRHARALYLYFGGTVRRKGRSTARSPPWEGKPAPHPPLVGKEPDLFFQATGITGQAAAGAYHSVTGDDDRDGICPTALPTPGPTSVQPAGRDLLGDPTIGPGLAVRGSRIDRPDRLLELAPFGPGPAFP